MGFFSDIANAANNAVDWAQDTAGDAVDAVQDAAEGVVDTAQDAVAAGAEAADDAVEWIADTGQAAFEAGVELVEGGVEEAGKVLGSVADTVGDVGEFLVERLWSTSPEENFNDLMDLGGRAIDVLSDIAQDTYETLEDAGREAVGQGIALIERAMNAAEQALEEGGELAEKTIEAAYDAIVTTAERVLVFLDDAKETVEDTAEAVVETAEEVAEQVWTKSPQEQAEELRRLLDVIVVNAR